MVPLALLAVLASSSFDFAVESGLGLTLEAGGVPIVKGSWFQFYAPGWSAGYYSSQNDRQEIKVIDPDTVSVSFKSTDGLASGSQTYHREGNHLQAHYVFRWDGDKPAKVEFTPGMLWAPAFADGTLLADGNTTRSLKPRSYISNVETDERRYWIDSTNFEFNAPFGQVKIVSSTPTMIFDARNGYAQGWAEGKSLLWFGKEVIDVPKGVDVPLDIDWQISPKTFATTPPKLIELTGQKTDSAFVPPDSHPVLIPKPKKDLLDWDHPTPISGVWNFPAGRVAYLPDLMDGLHRRFQFDSSSLATPAVDLDGGEAKLGLNPGAFRITIRKGSVSVIGQETEGYRNGLRRLAQLAFLKNGQMVLPTGQILDDPSTIWRGVHLFVGPDALVFQRKLWDRVLGPLGFNKVVLQCERTNWKSLPGIGTKTTMAREDLVKLFDFYRSINVEPIPLIQSYGHAEWLFANHQNLDIALNKAVPYAVDPRIPRTRKVLDSLWDEAIEALHPKTIHFGLDEVDMRGFEESPHLETELWNLHIPFLAEIAKRHQVKMMMWGDQIEAPGEAPDAAFGDTKEDAAKRRSVIPRGTFIADWHYMADSNPNTFLPSLTLLNNDDLIPVASAWYRPENVRGFDLAAAKAGFGTLQTTWAGYESDEPGFIRNFNQFAAMVLAGDYSWSARPEELKDLGYDPQAVLRQMYFGLPLPLGPLKGTRFSDGDGQDLKIGNTLFLLGSPIQLRSVIRAVASRAPESVVARLKGSGQHLAIAIDTLAALDEGAKVGELDIELADGSRIRKDLIYGQDVRAADDSGVTLFGERANGITGLTVQLANHPVEIRGLTLQSVDAVAGLRLHAVTLY